MAFYATVRRGQRTGLLAGPYALKADAEAVVNACRVEAVKADPFAHFDSYGVSHLSSDRPGKLNARIGYVSPEPEPDYLSGDGPPERFPAPSAEDRREFLAWLVENGADPYSQEFPESD